MARNKSKGSLAKGKSQLKQGGKNRKEDFYAYQSDAKTKVFVDVAMKAMAEATPVEMIVVAVRQAGASPQVAAAIVDACKEIVALEPEYVQNMLSQLRLAHTRNLNQIEKMYIEAEAKNDLIGMSKAISLRTRALKDIRGLLPNQVEIRVAGPEDHQHKVMFDLYDIEIEDKS
jgi:hypothetical protein